VLRNKEEPAESHAVPSYRSIALAQKENSYYKQSEVRSEIAQVKYCLCLYCVVIAGHKFVQYWTSIFTTNSCIT